MGKKLKVKIYRFTEKDCGIIDDVMKRCEKIEDRNIRLTNEIERLEKLDEKHVKALNETVVKYNKLFRALKFYADKSNYLGDMSKVWEDGGDIARAVLQTLQEKSEPTLF